MNIEHGTKAALAYLGVGNFVKDDEGNVVEDTVSDFTFRVNSDQAANMMLGFECFEGHECICHMVAVAFNAFYDQPGR